MRRILSWIFVLILVHVFCDQLEGQDEAKVDSDIEKIKSMMVSELRNEAQRIYRSEYDFLILEYTRYFQLDASTIETLNGLAAEFATKRAEGHSDDQIEKILQKKIREFEKLESFTVNGVRFAFEGSEQEPIVRMNLGIVNDYIFILMKTGKASMRSEVQINLRTNEKWRKALGDISDEQLNAFFRFQEEQRLVRLRRWVELLLVDDLKVTEDQIPALREWIEKHVDGPVSDATYSRAQREIVGLKFDLPDGFSDVQADAFRHLRIRYDQ